MGAWTTTARCGRPTSSCLRRRTLPSSTASKSLWSKTGSLTVRSYALAYTTLCRWSLNFNFACMSITGISLWIVGPEQGAQSHNLSSLVKRARTLVPRRSFSIFTGGYLTYSTTGWLPPRPFYELLNTSLELYDASQIAGFFVFAGSVLSKMNHSLWQTWDLPGHLQRHYQPWLGSAVVTVLDRTTSRPLAAVVTVAFDNVSHVTRKNSTVAAGGRVAFDGWAGRHEPKPQTVRVAAVGYESASVELQLQAQQTVSVTVRMERTADVEISEGV